MKNELVPVHPFPTDFPKIAARPAADCARSILCPGFPVGASAARAAATVQAVHQKKTAAFRIAAVGYGTGGRNCDCGTSTGAGGTQAGGVCAGCIITGSADLVTGSSKGMLSRCERASAMAEVADLAAP